MSVVLLAAGGFVYWRVSFALDRQLNQDLLAYSDLITKVVRAGEPLPADNPGEVSQTYSINGDVTAKSDQGVIRLLTPSQVTTATATPKQLDLGRVIVPGAHPYRVRYFTVETARGTVVVATAISRHKHDEALRELLGQLALADLATMIAAGLVGWGAVRAAFGPVERYRRAAAAAGGDPSRRLPVDTDRDDELTRLGTTFNTLLAEIEEGQVRERQFLADASHELRSPLALMAAEVEWARHRPRSEEEIATVLTSLGVQTQRLVDLSNALLDLEEATSTGFDRSIVAADVLIESAIADLRELAIAAGRSIEVLASSAEVRIDQRWVGLAVGNLVANAIKHGSGTIKVAVEVGQGDSPMLRIDVTDEGGGIPTDLGVKAFDRFARADTSRSTPGNGLGLALVAAIARRNGGTAALVPGGIEIEIPCD
ncbi:signal transduction histidine kinase [Nocardioides aromaticivorans]|uniref:histidine kinase n=1 Tax=Nocardioides aromaticivorans TaxID=200618 RepID=A0A7Y9ZMC8_9ACTN|nr:HAMP domain-containing sensor histidine kinase [Nocardioides aromaticivorans]NYI46585.1 signal transduction histidine kinase [Nocardioides aromaticivorans]